jgi:hypothetical protein
MLELSGRPRLEGMRRGQEKSAPTRVLLRCPSRLARLPLDAGSSESVPSGIKSSAKLQGGKAKPSPGRERRMMKKLSP